MPHAVTQSCVGDGSCTYACPVNCIQPTPDDPAFELAEMLFIDPAACVDCGACLTACPVDAIKPHSMLDETEKAFLTLNAEFHAERRERPLLAPIPDRLRVRDRGETIRVAIVGSGPAAMYAADELLTIPGARVDVYERLHRPFGLVRSGVAPDHRRTRRVSRQLEQISQHSRLRLHLGVSVGRDVSHEQLAATHHAVIYAVGSMTDRPLTIPGADLPGVHSATEFVGWYNGHPDFEARAFDLSHRRAVVIGNGNVALDVARMLTVNPDSLADTEIAPAALRALRESQVEEVVVIGRRGPEHAAFTLPELVGLSTTPGIALDVDLAALAAVPQSTPKLDFLRSLPAPSDGRRITLRYLLTPQQILGHTHATGIELEPQTTGADHPAPADPVVLDAGLVLTAIGYHGMPVAALPFDSDRGTVPNRAGRAVDPATGAAMPATYVVGWIKRGPSGFIGTNKRCAQETVRTLIDDYNAGLIPNPTPAPRGRLRRLSPR